MKRGWRWRIVGAIALPSTVASTSARAEQAHPWDAALTGAVMCGSSGSAIDLESDHPVAGSTGMLLGSLDVGHHVTRPSPISGGREPTHKPEEANHDG